MLIAYKVFGFNDILMYFAVCVKWRTWNHQRSSRCKLKAVQSQLVAFIEYLPKDFLKHKLVVIAEMVGGEAAEYYIRTLISEGMIRHAVTIQNPETGKFETQIVEMSGPVGILQTTTSIQINPENKTRMLEVRPDDSLLQTERIHALQKKERTKNGLNQAVIRAAIISKHQNAQRLLKPMDVIIPYAPLLQFAAPKYTLRVRRDLPKFLDLISAVAVLRQHQREIMANAAGVEFIEASVEDYQVAYDLASEVFRESLDNIPPKSRELLEIIKAKNEVPESQKGDLGSDRVNFTRNDARQWSGWPESTVRKYIKPLEEEGYLTIMEGGFGGKPIEYDTRVDNKKQVQTGLLDPTELMDKIADQEKNRQRS